MLKICNEVHLEESCLLDLKDVRGILMEFFKEELIQNHEINAKKGSYAYSINLKKYLKKVKGLLYMVSLLLAYQLDSI